MKGRRKRPIPKRPNGRGYPRIKRSFGRIRGVVVGKINISSGTNDARTYHQLHAMLDDLAERGESGVLVRIRDSSVALGDGSNSSPRQYEILEVFRSWRANRHVPNITGWRPLAESMPDWLQSAETVNSGRLADRTRKSYECNIRQLLKVADRKGGEVPTDAQLPQLLLSYRGWCAEREYRVPFNQTKTMCLSYARSTQRDGRDSDLYREIRRVPGLSTKHKRDRKNLTVREVREIMSKLPAREAQHVWNMCCLSIRPDEYARDQWTIVRDDAHGSFVQIDGTKTSSASRQVPLVNGVAKVRFAESTFRRRLRQVVGNSYVPRDFRSTGKRWRLKAGIEETRCLQYFGHSTSAMKHRYDTDDLLQHVGLDADLLNDFIEKNETARASVRRGERELVNV